jgi:Mor family transcriptional regulator
LSAWEKFGPEDVEKVYRDKYAKNKERIKSKENYYFKEKLYGMLSFLRMVKGEDEVYLKLCFRASELDNNPPKIISEMKRKYKMHDVFISHASEDKKGIVRPIFDACEEIGVSAFLDEEEIAWDDSLTEKLNHALGKSKIFLAVLSENSIDKKWPRREINSALARQADGRQKFLPLIIGDPNLDSLGLTSDLLYVKWGGDAEDIAKKFVM